MNGYHSELALHIIFAIATLGGVFLLPFLQAASERSGAGATRFYVRFLARVSNLVIFPGAALVFVFGGLLMSNNHFYGHDSPPAWLVVSLIWFVAAALLSFLVLRSTLPQAERTLAGLPDPAPLPDAYLPLGRRIQLVLGLFGVSIIVIAFLMVYQPGH